MQKTAGVVTEGVVGPGEDGELPQDQEEHAPPYPEWNPGGEEGDQCAAV